MLMHNSCGGCKRISAFFQQSILDVPQQPVLIHTVEVFPFLYCAPSERNAQSSINRPSLQTTMDRGSGGRGREGSSDQSILSFAGAPGRAHMQPGQLQAKPGQAEMGRSHASNTSHTDMETPREVLFKQALFHTVSYLPIHGLCHREMMSQKPIMHLSLLISTLEILSASVC